jgi:hypothetical protein
VANRETAREAANREAAARTGAAPVSGGPGLGARLAGANGIPGVNGVPGNNGVPAQGGFAGAAQGGFGGTNGGNGGGYAPGGLGASLMASEPTSGAPVSGAGRWAGLTDSAHPTIPASVEYQHGSGEPLPQRPTESPNGGQGPNGGPAPTPPWPPTSPTLAQQFQNRPRTTQDH